MGWTAYINVYAAHGADLEKAKAAAVSECDRFLVLPGSEALTVRFEGFTPDNSDYPAYEHVGFGFCKIQSSLNPVLSLTSAMYVAKGIASQLNNDFVIEFFHDYGDERDAKTFTRSELLVSELQAMLLWPVFLLSNLPRTIGFLLGLIFRPIYLILKALRQKAFNDQVKSMAFKTIKAMPEDLSTLVVKLHPGSGKIVPQSKISVVGIYHRNISITNQYLYLIKAETAGIRFVSPFWHILTSNPQLKQLPAFKIVSCSNPQIEVLETAYGTFERIETPLSEFNNRFALYLPNKDCLSFFSPELLSKILNCLDAGEYFLGLEQQHGCLVCHLQVKVVNPFRPTVGYDSKTAIHDLVSITESLIPVLLNAKS